MQKIYRKLRKYWLAYRKHPLRMQSQIRGLNEKADSVRQMLADVVWHLETSRLPTSHQSEELWLHGYKVYSQQDEDGILSEIFRRIGTSSKFFVEIGVQDGMCNNTLYLLAQGWEGVWMERREEFTKRIRQTFATQIERGQLRVKEEFVTAENATSLFGEENVPPEFDLLSIDIDGNDYWIWKALDLYRPRVVAIEYNAGLGPSLKWIQEYDPHWTWGGSRYQGASLEALTQLGREKGYALVGCNFSGVNAFFVRSDLVAGHFCEEHTARRHYRRPKYYWSIFPGHRPDPMEVRGFRVTRGDEAEE